jgi:hypothetical protein
LVPAQTRLGCFLFLNSNPALAIITGSPIAIYHISQARKAEAIEGQRAQSEALASRQNLYAADMLLTEKALADKNARIGNNVVFSWSTNHIGYILEATDELSSSLNWSKIDGSPTIMGDQFVLTNSLSGGSRFFRLKR